MIVRYIKLGPIPEIHTEPHFMDRDTPEVEVKFPLEVFWELEELQKKIAYFKFSGHTDVKILIKFKKLLTKYVVHEKSRFMIKNSM